MLVCPSLAALGGVGTAMHPTTILVSGEGYLPSTRRELISYRVMPKKHFISVLGHTVV